MTTTEHLAKIRAKCVELLKKSKQTTEYWKNEYGLELETDHEQAGWRSTIAAIDGLQSYMSMSSWIGTDIIRGIISAWPEELL